MACILVTGGAGFLGSHLVDALVQDGHAVRVLDDLSSGTRENLPRQIEFIYGDVTDEAAVERAFDGIEACFHLAAIAAVVRSSCEWRRTHEVNLTGTINIFEQARRLRDRQGVPIVYASTAAVYGDCNSVPISEQHPAAPLSAYGADKRACELHAQIAGSVHGIPTVGLRFFNLHGPDRIQTHPTPVPLRYLPTNRLVASLWRFLATGSRSATLPILAMRFSPSLRRCGLRAPAPRYLTSAPVRGPRSRRWRRRWLRYIAPSWSPIIGRRDRPK